MLMVISRIFCVRLLQVCSFNYDGLVRASVCGAGNMYGSHAFLFSTNLITNEVGPAEF